MGAALGKQKQPLLLCLPRGRPGVGAFKGSYRAPSGPSAEPYLRIFSGRNRFPSMLDHIKM